MSCRIVGDSEAVIPVQELLDGQLAVIRRWGSDHEPIGWVVQRYKDVLVTLGERSGRCSLDILGSLSSYPDCFVRVLPPGTKIEVG